MTNNFGLDYLATAILKQVGVSTCLPPRLRCDDLGAMLMGTTSLRAQFSQARLEERKLRVNN